MSYTGLEPRFSSTILTDIAAGTPANPAAGSYKLVNRSGALFLRDSSGTEVAVNAGAPTSQVTATQGNGNGATSTMIRIFLGQTTVGSDITHTSDANLGSYFTITRNGLYLVEYTDQHNTAGAAIGISLDTTQPTVAIYAKPVGYVTHVEQGSANRPTQVVSLIRITGQPQVIRCHNDAAASPLNSDAIVRCKITQLALL